MAEEIVLAGKTYISSKRASELSQYNRDYISQLARGGLVEAKRIGGLWYVSRDSLDSYSNSPDGRRPSPSGPISLERSQESEEATITFDGRDFISAPRAAKLTGYHQDYIGQLSRSGKIASRQIGNRWYVDRTALQTHKEEKDNLLGAVQSEAVGIQRGSKASSAPPPEPLHYQYVPEARRKDLIPSTFRHEAQSSRSSDDRQWNSLPIRKGLTACPHPVSRKGPYLAAAALTFVIILGIGAISLRSVSSFSTSGIREDLRYAASAAAVQNSVGKLAAWVEDVFGTELVYVRSQ